MIKNSPRQDETLHIFRYIESETISTQWPPAEACDNMIVILYFHLYNMINKYLPYDDIRNKFLLMKISLFEFVIMKL